MFIPFMRTLSFRIYKSLLTHHIGEPTKSYKNLQVRHKKFENFSFSFSLTPFREKEIKYT